MHLISFKPDSPVANAYLDLVCRCFQHTSKKITEKLLGVWYYVLERLPGYIDAPVIKNRIGWLGNVLYEKVLRHGSPEDPAINSPFTQYGMMDFEDHDSFLQSLGIVRSRIITAIKAVARKYPEKPQQDTHKRRQNSRRGSGARAFARYLHSIATPRFVQRDQLILVRGRPRIAVKFVS